MNIQPIVEGHGDISAVPILLRRLQVVAGAYGIGIGTPVRRPSSDIRDKERFQRGISLALRQPDCGAVLVLFDAEDDCPATLGPRLLEWAREITGEAQCDVVLAYREFETWLLAGIESLRDRSGIRAEAVAPLNPESRRGAKEALEEWMPRGRSYSETTDQASLTSVVDLQLVWQRSRSFRKFVSAFGEQARALGEEMIAWPPAHWL